MEIILISFIFFAGCMIWGLYCNNITHSQRLYKIEECQTMDDIEKFTKVSYDAHLVALILLRDPNKLYDK